MTAKQMTESQIARFWRAMEEQGVGVTRTKKGLMLRLPDGSSTVKHFTESDVRATPNLISRLRRAGIVHPDDPRGPSKLPTYITSPKPKEKTLDKARKVIERLGYPERVATSELYDEFGITDSGRMLYFLGYTPSVIRGQRGMRLWDAPPELDARFMNEVQDEVIEVEEETEIAATQVFPDPEPDPEPDLLTIAVENTQLAEPDDYLPPQPMDLTDEEADAYDTAMAEADRIEFLDERDSWVVDLKELLGYTWPQVEDKLKMLGVLGMDYEFRVWRKR